MLTPAEIAILAAVSGVPVPLAKGELGGVCGQPTCSCSPATFKDRWTGEHVCAGCAEDRNRRARALHGANAEPYCEAVAAKPTESPIVNLPLEADLWDNAFCC